MEISLIMICLKMSRLPLVARHDNVRKLISHLHLLLVLGRLDQPGFGSVVLAECRDGWFLLSAVTFLERNVKRLLPIWHYNPVFA